MSSPNTNAAVVIILTGRNLKMKPTADNPDVHIRGQ
jgi:hypothetical protein